MNDPGSQNARRSPSVGQPGFTGCLFWLFVFSPSNIQPPELSATEVGFFLLLSVVVLSRLEKAVSSMATAGKRCIRSCAEQALKKTRGWNIMQSDLYRFISLSLHLRVWAASC